MIIVNLLVIVLLLFANGFFVASEFALVSVRQTRMQQLANEGNKTAQIATKALLIASQICVFTNDHITVEEV